MNYVRWFNQIHLDDINLVGGKNASLGEMIATLSSQGVRVPNGFAVTCDAYWQVVRANNLQDTLAQILGTIQDHHNLAQVQNAGSRARALFLDATIPDDIIKEIEQCYNELVAQYGGRGDVAVRSSATAEDLPGASFAGQQETYLNISSFSELLSAYKKCLASLFTDRALVYRQEHRFDHFKVALSVGVQKMIRSDEACSGVAFTVDTESGFEDVVLIESSWGLGEAIVQGMVTPDSFWVHKPTLALGYAPIIRKSRGDKRVKMIYASSGGNSIESVVVPVKEREQFTLSDEEILTIARLSVAIENHYAQKSGHTQHMDIEWAKDGIDQQIYIIQARPETVHNRKKSATMTSYSWQDPEIASKAKLLISGTSVGSQIAVGTARVVQNLKQMNRVQPGDILVTDMTDPDWLPVVKQAAGVITNRGGRTCHAAIVSRELGIPAIIGTQHATLTIRDGQEITIDCSRGLSGYVYEGQLPFTVKEISFSADKKRESKTKLLVTVANPENAFTQSFLPVDGVGLVRIEFIIANSIQIHPCALLYPEKIDDKKIAEQIEQLTSFYTQKSDYFVDILSQGIATIAAAFYPRPVVVRFSDFKTNEYRNLIGGSFFEPAEENPMLGFRGASRYYHELYRHAFALECQAIKRVRETMGLQNVSVMVPFVRTLSEAQLVIQELKNNGLVSGEQGLSILMMCELPSNVVLIEEFASYFDGFSIGSNDLTQMVLGVDRDSQLLAALFNETDPAVVKMITAAIDGAHKAGKPIGICGQAPSDFPDFASKLVAQGIDSVSLNPDSVIPFLTKD